MPKRRRRCPRPLPRLDRLDDAHERQPAFECAMAALQKRAKWAMAARAKKFSAGLAHRLGIGRRETVRRRRRMLTIEIRGLRLQPVTESGEQCTKDEIVIFSDPQTLVVAYSSEAGGTEYRFQIAVVAAAPEQPPFGQIVSSTDPSGVWAGQKRPSRGEVIAEEFEE